MIMVLSRRLARIAVLSDVFIVTSRGLLVVNAPVFLVAKSFVKTL
jgi:hypothetical protein